MGINHVQLISLAERRLGIITIDDLHSIGITRLQVDRLVANGELRRLHRGQVYCLGSAHLDLDAEIIAVCLAVPSGWISGVTAANYWGMRGVPRGRIEITVPSSRRPRLTLARVRRTNLRNPEIMETIHGARVSSPAQTLFELAYELDDRALRTAYEYSLENGLVTFDDISRIGANAIAMGRNGSTRFRRVICDRPSELPPVMSNDELILIEALASVGIHVERQFPIVLPGGSTVFLDGAISTIRLGLEIDGPTHDTAVKVHRDKHRDLLLAAEGWQILRPTTDDIRSRLRATVSIIQAVVCERRRQLAA